MTYQRHCPARNWGARIREITMAGLPAVVLENELIRVTVLPGRGCDITEFCYKPRDMDFTWLPPWALPNPADSAGTADGAGSFFDTYSGGWQEILPNGGAACTYRGAALGQHAEVSALPWDAEITADEPGEVAVTCTVRTRRLPLALRKTLRLASGHPTLLVEEELINTGPVDVEAMWGHHIAFGAPFLREGCRVTLPDGISVIPHDTAIDPPDRRVSPGGPWDWPRVPAQHGGSIDLSVVPGRGAASDIVYLAGFGERAWYEITDPALRLGLRVGWDGGVLPYLWLWQESGATTDYPWWGQVQVTGLEPFSSYPTSGLAAAAANGTALRLPGHARRELRMEITVVDEEAQ
jgi:hypothetical protein